MRFSLEISACAGFADILIPYFDLTAKLQNIRLFYIVHFKVSLGKWKTFSVSGLLLKWYNILSPMRRKFHPSLRQNIGIFGNTVLSIINSQPKQKGIEGNCKLSSTYHVNHLSCYVILEIKLKLYIWNWIFDWLKHVLRLMLFIIICVLFSSMFNVTSQQLWSLLLKRQWK